MKNEFLEALGSNNANNNTDLSLYSRFVGNWSFTMTTYDEEGKIEDTKEGEWLFSYVMDGYGIQDVFICPKRGEWTEEDTLYGDYGTTIRVPMIDNSKKWNIVYVSKWSVDRLIAEELENDIIQIVKKRIEGGANEKAVLRLFINCPFVCINFDFFWLNKARQLYMDF